MFLQPPVQDTCVALQSLSEYAILSYVGGVNLTISLASTNLDFQETFELNRDNQKLLQSAKVTTSTETVTNINDFFKRAPQCFCWQMRHDDRFATLLPLSGVDSSLSTLVGSSTNDCQHFRGATTLQEKPQRFNAM